MDLDEVEEIQGPEDSPPSQHPAGSTLLPTPIANVVSLLTRSSSLYLRLGTFIGGLALDGARVTTLTGLELSRAVIEGILSRAGRDVAIRSTGELGRAEAEGILEKSIATLHTTITNISFAASTGFYFSAAALASATDLSQQLLATLDSILGSTDSSRAIASIITLIRREFQNPATGVDGEKVSVSDLLMGICGLALLQRWCRKLADAECREHRYEEVLWDVVILDKGRRVDVVGTNTHYHITGPNTEMALDRAESKGPLSFMTTGGDEVLETIEREGESRDDSDEDMPEINLKQRIMRSLPADASVSITTSTTTTKTITVEITGTQPPDLSLPPGVEIIEENAHHTGNFDLDGDGLTNEQQIGLLIPRYRVVYRIIRNNLRGTNIEARRAVDDNNDLIDQSGAESKESSGFMALKLPGSQGFVVSPISSPDSDSPPELPRQSSRQAQSLPKKGGPRAKAPSSLSADSGDESRRRSALALSRGNAENMANQKRSRKPTSAASSVSGSNTPPPIKISGGRPSAAKKTKSDKSLPKLPDKRPSFRNALKKGSGTTLSNLWSKEAPARDVSASVPQPKPGQQRPPWGSGNSGSSTAKPSMPHLSVPQRGSSNISPREKPGAPQRGNPNFFSSRDLGLMQAPDLPRSPSRTSYYSIHERRRDSLVSQTDTYSIHSPDQARPVSPTTFRTHLKAQSSLLRARSEKNITVKQPSSPAKMHRRATSHVPSIYTLRTSNSNTSLVLASYPQRSVFEDSDALESLMRTGFVDGLFPQHHIVRNITRFVRFASASYGANFLRFMGITTSTGTTTREVDVSHHHEHHSFSNHTQLPPDTILLSSFVDPQGGTDSSGHTNTGVPMVHFVSLDHESKAVVLTCRGTLGFEDVLTDLTCDYDEILWRGKRYKVHKGIHASAQRLLDGGGGRVLATIKAALEEFADYGLVMCGHSLGAGVTALLAIMVAEPGTSGSAFVTSADYQRPRLLLTSGNNSGFAPSNLRLPPGRPIHVYAYGPPATISPSLRLATRGLITTVINGQDLVPYLSLGVLHDLQAVALAFKTDDSGAKGEVRSRVWAGFTSTFADKWYSNRPEAVGKEEDDQWAYSALKALRACMLSSKLSPPGEVFVVEAMPVLKRNAFVMTENDGGGEAESLGKPATRSVLKYVRDVEKRFGEVRFGGSMLLDHSPGRYEASLGALKLGVLEG